MVKASTEGLIWLVVGVFWIIAQIFQSAAQKKQKEQKEQGRKEGDRDDESFDVPPAAAESFADLVRRLSGEQERFVEPPEWIEAEDEQMPASEPVAVRSQAAWSRSELEQLPDIEPAKRARISVLTPKPREPSVDVAQHLRPKLSDFRTGTSMIKLPSMILRMSSPTLSTSASDRSRNATAPNLRDRRVLRRAMLGHVILDKPRALQPPGFGHA